MSRNDDPTTFVAAELPEELAWKFRGLAVDLRMTQKRILIALVTHAVGEGERWVRAMVEKVEGPEFSGPFGE